MGIVAAIGRLVKRVPERSQLFAIYHDSVLVANVMVVDGLDEAIAATEQAGSDPQVYVPGLHISGLATQDASNWFASWRGTGTKRDLAIRDHVRDRIVLVTGAFVSAWSDGAWYDLVIDTAVVDISSD